MKRILIAVLLVLIALLFLWAAHLDGIIAFAEEEEVCEFCEFLEHHDLQEDLKRFPQVEIGSMKSIDYNLELNAKLIFGHDRSASVPLFRSVELNFCPVCGRQINGTLQNDGD